jgi:acetolactate synthase-1/3 small subunit
MKIYQAFRKSGRLFFYPKIKNMKQSNNQEAHYNVVVYANDRNGILGNILMLFNRPGYEIGHLNVARTDIHDVILIALEVTMPAQQLNPMLHKIQKIIDVYRAFGHASAEQKLHQVAHYRLGNYLLNSSTCSLLQKHGASIIELLTDSFIIQKTGSAIDINTLYNQLEGEYLLGFCTSGLLFTKSLFQINELFAEKPI